MDSRTTKLLIETIVKKAIKDMDDSPKRSIRNLVDMALQFSKGRFQQQFFIAAQTMLKNQNSAYYALTQDVVSHVDFDHLVAFSMNLGYNSCTAGAKKIREIEENSCFNVPWSITMHLEEKTYADHVSLYHQRIEEGESMGIYTWQIFCDSNPSHLLSLCEKHQNSAFILFCHPKHITAATIEEISTYKNIMLALSYTEESHPCYQWLRQKKLPYSIYYVYETADIPHIESGVFFDECEQHHPIFTALKGSSSVPFSEKEAVYHKLKNFRGAQTYQTIPWELSFDSGYIDGIISDDACTVEFDCNGFLHTPFHDYTDQDHNLLHVSLEKMFRSSLLK